MSWLWIIGGAIILVFLLKIFLKTLKIMFILAILALLAVVFYLWQQGLLLR